MHKHAPARGVWGHAPSKIFLEFRGYKIASETIFGPQTMLLGGQMTEFYTLSARCTKWQLSIC